jgi:integrase
MKDLCERYLKDWAPRKKTAKGDLRFINARILPAFGKRKLTSITHDEIIRFHRNYGAPIQANRCISLLSKMFNLAKEWGMLDRKADNPASNIHKNPEKERTRYITKLEMPRILNAVHQHPDIYVKNAILLLLFTGLRLSSVVTLKWNDVNFDASILHERNAKTKKQGEIEEHKLCTAALNVLKDTPIKINSEFIFPSTSKKALIAKLERAWEKIKKNAEIIEKDGNKLWLHDLRRTVGSWMAINNYNAVITMKALNHKKLQTAQKYQRIADQDVIRNALDDITSKMLATNNRASLALLK